MKVPSGPWSSFFCLCATTLKKGGDKLPQDRFGDSCTTATRRRIGPSSPKQKKKLLTDIWHHGIKVMWIQNPCPDPSFTLMRIRIRSFNSMRTRIMFLSKWCESATTNLQAIYGYIKCPQAVIVSVHGPLWLNFSHLQLLNFDFADTDRTFHSNLDPDPGSTKTDPCGSGSTTLLYQWPADGRCKDIFYREFRQ